MAATVEDIIARTLSTVMEEATADMDMEDMTIHHLVVGTDHKWVVTVVEA